MVTQSTQPSLFLIKVKFFGGCASLSHNSIAGILLRKHLNHGLRLTSGAGITAASENQFVDVEYEKYRGLRRLPVVYLYPNKQANIEGYVIPIAYAVLLVVMNGSTRGASTSSRSGVY